MKWLYSQNTKPKIPSQKFLNQNLNFCKKPSLKFWTATNKKLWNLINAISAKLNFLSPNEMPMKLENYKKPISIYAPYNFVFSCYPHLMGIIILMIATGLYRMLGHTNYLIRSDMSLGWNVRGVKRTRGETYVGYMSFRPTPFQPLQFQPFTLSTVQTFNRLPIRPLANSTACKFNRHKFDLFN